MIRSLITKLIKFVFFFMSLLMVTSCYSQTVYSDQQIKKQIITIDQMTHDTLGIRLGTLVSLLKYESGNYYPIWYLEEQDDMQRIKDLQAIDLISYEILDNIGNPRAKGPFVRIFHTDLGRIILDVLTQ